MGLVTKLLQQSGESSQQQKQDAEVAEIEAQRSPKH